MGRLVRNHGCSRMRPSVMRSAGSAFSICSSRFMQSALTRSDAGTLMKHPAGRCIAHRKVRQQFAADKRETDRLSRSASCGAHISLYVSLRQVRIS